MTKLIDRLPPGTKGRHVIRRHTIELRLINQEEAHALQEEVHRLYHTELLQVMDEVMSQAVDQDEVIQFDRMELDLGALDPQHLQEQLALLTREHLARVLQQEISAVRHGEDSQSKGRMIRAEDSKLQVLQVFLRTGQVPWWVPLPINLEHLLEELLRSRLTEVSIMLRNIDSSVAMRRVNKQFSLPLQQQLIRTLAGDQASMIESLTREWICVLEALPPTPAVLPRHAYTSQKDMIYQHILTYLGTSPPSMGRRSECSEYLVRCLIESGGVGRREFLALLRDSSHHVLPVTSTLRQWVESRWQKEYGPVPSPGDFLPNKLSLFSSDAESGHHSIGNDSGGALNVCESTENSYEKLEKVNHQWPKLKSDGDLSVMTQGPSELLLHDHSSSGQDEREHNYRLLQSREWDEPLDLTEGQYITNAGLVLLGPFLTNFFEKVAMLYHKTFISHEIQERAVLLLQHVITGEREWSEHDLLLNKLLTGWTVNEPVAKRLVVTEVEQHESLELLCSVIEHWSALKHISIDGLRRAFFLREGRLNVHDQGWTLVIARTGYDILLDQLPWGIGTILLPWMSAPLSVEW